MTLPNLPAAREEAERISRELVEAVRGIDSLTTPWEERHPAARDTLVAAHLALLTDLRRPASRDHWARYGANTEITRAGTDAYRDPSLVPGILRKWGNLRDEPELLASALLSLTPTTPDAGLERT